MGSGHLTRRRSRASAETRTGIVALTEAQVDALIAGDEVFTARFGLAVAPGYLDEPAVLPVVRDALAAGMPPEWGSRLIVDEVTDTVVGFGGFKGPPREGEVEIGYSIAPGHRRLGHASAAVDLLLREAGAGGARLVCAHTLAHESPSTRLLARAGFRKVEEFLEEDLGGMWRWELPLA